jgi:hypothetical protein
MFHSRNAVAPTSAFWSLVERWRVSDTDVLELIEFAGKLGKVGKRPRFSFSPKQSQLVASL